MKPTRADFEMIAALGKEKLAAMNSLLELAGRRKDTSATDILAFHRRATEIASVRYPNGCASATILAAIMREAIKEVRREQRALAEQANRDEGEKR